MGIIFGKREVRKMVEMKLFRCLSEHIYREKMGSKTTDMKRFYCVKYNKILMIFHFKNGAQNDGYEAVLSSL